MYRFSFGLHDDVLSLGTPISDIACSISIMQILNSKEWENTCQLWINPQVMGEEWYKKNHTFIPFSIETSGLHIYLKYSAYIE